MNQELITAEEAVAALGFVQSGEVVAAPPTVAAAVAREEGRVRSMILVAHHRPRDEAKAAAAFYRACERIGVAKKAQYKFPRGGTTVIGPSVSLARELKRHWGNIESGIGVVEDTPDSRLVVGYAHDLETNTYTRFEARFNKKVQRKDKRTGVTTWEDKSDDEREMRESTAKYGGICERNALLQLMPCDVIEGGMKKSTATRILFAQGSLEKGRDQVLQNLLHSLGKHAVSVDMVDAYLGHKLGDINEMELADLDAILASLDDGHAQRSEYFKVGPTPSKGGEIDLADIDGSDKKTEELFEEEAPAAEEEDSGLSTKAGSMTKHQLEKIQDAIKGGGCNHAAMQGWRKSQGLKKGAKTSAAQAAQLLDLIESGEVMKYDKDPE
jgi:hypothetical protein